MAERGKGDTVSGKDKVVISYTQNGRRIVAVSDRREIGQALTKGKTETMANFKMVTVEEAPKAPAKGTGLTKEQKEFDDMLAQVIKSGQVGALEVSDKKDEDGEPIETTRSMKVRIRWAATRAGKEVKSWDVGNTVYFRVTGDAKKEEKEEKNGATPAKSK